MICSGVFFVLDATVINTGAECADTSRMGNLSATVSDLEEQ